MAAATSGSIQVLHVDDEPDFAEVVAKFVERQDDRVNVETATNPSDALDRIHANGVHCVVSDYDMPEQNGIEFLEAVREVFPDLPFILYTGKGSEEVASEAIAAGVSDYLQKESGTSQYEVLANRILNLVEKRRAKEEVAENEYWTNRLLEHSSDYLFVVDDSGKISYVSPSVRRVLGYEPDKIMGEDAFEFTYPQDIEKATEAFADTLERPEEDVSEEFRAKHADGGYRWLSVRGRNLLDDPIIEGILVNARDITERKEREQELRELERFNREIVENAPAGILRLDEKMQITYENKRAEDIIGVPEGEDQSPAVGKDLRDLPSVQASGTIEALRRLEAGETVSFDTKFESIFGKESHLTGKGVPLFDGDDFDGAVIIVVDETERGNREREQQETRRRLNLALEATETGVWEWNMETDEVDWSESLEQLLGIEPGTFEGTFEAFEEYLHPDDATTVDQAIEQAIQSDGAFSAEFRMIRTDGNPIWVRGLAEYFNEDGSERMLGTTTDITEFKEREQQLDQYRTLVDTVGDPMHILDAEGYIELANEAMMAYLGADEETVTGTHISEYMAEGDHERAKQRLVELRNTPDAQWATVEFTAVTADGDRIPAQTNIAVLTDEAGKFDGSVGVVRDITELKAREDELRETTKQLQDIIDTVEAAIWVRNAGTEYEYMNQYSRDMFDIADDVEVAGKQFSDLLPAEVAEQFQQNDQRVYETEEPIEIEETVETDDGPRDFLTRIVPLVENGSVYATCGIATDITERNERKLELLRQNKRLEEFASIVSHDLRNPLNVAAARLELATEDSESDHLDAASQALDRMEELIENMLSLAKAGEDVGETTTVELPILVESCWQNVETESTTFRIETEASIRADQSRLQQLIENLLRNAVEHGGSEVTVTVGDLPDGFYVEDDGPGIPPEAREDVFEAGHSTSEDGTGFGLSIVKQIVDAHDWSLRVTEGTDGGARFEITGIDFAAELAL